MKFKVLGRLNNNQSKPLLKLKVSDSCIILFCVNIKEPLENKGEVGPALGLIKVSPLASTSVIELLIELILETNPGGAP